jgi:hypothetical protein
MSARDEAAAHVQAEEKSSPTRADATPGLTTRQARLLDAIRTHGGAWTTRRVLHLFALTDDPDNRHYALTTRKDCA